NPASAKFNPDDIPHSSDLGALRSSPPEPAPTEWKRNGAHWWEFWKPRYDEVALPADDKYRSFDQLKAKLCLQTLAFENRQRFAGVCSGEVLRSIFDDPRDAASSEQRLSSSYDHYRQKYPFDRPTTGESICAFRDFGRRNLVYW